MPSYKVNYFNGKGRGEIVRLILHTAGVKFEDNRIDRPNWPALKPNTPWGSLPTVEVDGKLLAQSGAIARYLAKQHGLMGSGAWEEAMIDSVYEATTDLFTACLKVHFADEAKKAEEAKKFNDEILPRHLDMFEKFTAANGKSGHSVGSKINLADLALFNILDQLVMHKFVGPDLLKKYPKVNEVYEHVRTHEKLADYIKSRPETPF